MLEAVDKLIVRTAWIKRELGNVEYCGSIYKDEYEVCMFSLVVKMGRKIPLLSPIEESFKLTNIRLMGASKSLIEFVRQDTIRAS